MRGITLVHVQPLGHGHARDAMPADVIANACNAKRWVGGGVGKMCSNLKYKKMVAINLEKIIFRALKKKFHQHLCDQVFFRAETFCYPQYHGTSTVR